MAYREGGVCAGAGGYSEVTWALCREWGLWRRAVVEWVESMGVMEVGPKGEGWGLSVEARTLSESGWGFQRVGGVSLGEGKWKG